ncbi:MAG TPA: 16S rRNA (guanine(527)-N(7))-methyltransferase RsmG [Planctomycetaceae bacterium]|nr:16S rRNA (guanine(527)-N(7))-methyltransferase RsmG [Planctomycetaceae bacterium]
MADSLKDVLESHQIALSDHQIQQLEEYCRLLWSWNKKINLTRHTDYELFVTRDLIDTIELSKLIGEGQEVLDFGSGGGVPGIPLAILRDDIDVSLCESVGKKAKALANIIGELRLPVPVNHARVEDLLDDLRFDVITCRAVGPLWKLCFWLNEHWHSIIQVLAIKGPKWVDERAEARHRGLMDGVNLRKAASYPMIGTESESVILKIWPGYRDEP